MQRVASVVVFESAEIIVAHRINFVALRSIFYRAKAQQFLWRQTTRGKRAARSLEFVRLMEHPTGPNDPGD
jgi:hypothetical protein